MQKVHICWVYITHLQVAVSWTVTVETLGVVDSELELITVAVSVVRHWDIPRVHGRVGRCTPRRRRQRTLQYSCWQERSIVCVQSGRLHQNTHKTRCNAKPDVAHTVILLAAYWLLLSSQSIGSHSSIKSSNLFACAQQRAAVALTDLLIEHLWVSLFRLTWQHNKTYSITITT